MISPSGAHTELAFGESLPLYPPQTRHTRFTLQIGSPFSSDGFGIYSEAGIWTVQQIALQSKDGTIVSYYSPQVAKLFPSAVVEIVNQTPDVTAPRVGSGAILTPTVNLSSISPKFVASLAVADNLSGVATVLLTIQSPENSSTQYAYLSLPAPLLKGTAYPGLSFNAQSATGTYTIIGYQLCDYANNCLSDNVAADIKTLFGTTTFEVTP